MDSTRGHQDSPAAFGLNNLASTSTQNLAELFPVNASFNNLFQNQALQQQLAQSMQPPTFSNPFQQLAMQMGSHVNSPQINGAGLQPQQGADQQMRYTPPLPGTSSSSAPAQQNPPPVNPAAWFNQLMPAGGFPGGISPLTLNLPLFSQAIFQDAIAMSKPIEPTDEPLLLTTLLNSRRKNESYKDALNSLHGKSNHSASLWKDYYLDHKDRIDEWIVQCLQKEKEDRAKAGKSAVKRSQSSDIDRARSSSLKRPSPTHFKRESSPHPSSLLRASISAPAPKRPYKKAQASTPPVPLPQPSRRSTINSLTAPEPVFGGRLPAPNTQVRVPEPPSRSPSPPTSVVPRAGRGNKYTKEDRDYFIKFIGWHLKLNPDLTRQDLCSMLAEKAPHHTAQSWASHWSNNHDLPDKILAAARGDVESASEAESSRHGKQPVHRKPLYKEDSTSADEEDDDDDDDGVESSSEDESSGRSETPERALRVYSDKDMAEAGHPFNEADLYVTAKHIASFSDWNSVSTKDRWTPMGTRYPQRSDKSWAEYYRRNEKALLALAKKIKAEQRKSIQTQCARPTMPMAKRKLDLSNANTIPAKKTKS